MELKTLKHRGTRLTVKTLLSVCLLALLPTGAKAQVKLGIKGGIDVSELTFSDDVFKKSNRMGFYVGPILKIPLFGLGFDIAALYTRRNGELKGSSDANLDGKYKFSDKMVVVPIHVRYGINFGEGAIFALAGPQFGFNLDDEEKSLKDNVASWRSRDSQLSFDIGGEVTVNYNIPLGKAGEVRLKDATDQVLTKGTYKTWKISAAYFF